MRARLTLLLLCVAALPACVTTGTFNQLKAHSDDLQSQLDEIHKEASGLQSDLGVAKQSNEKLVADKTSLKEQKDALEKTQASLEAKTAELEKAQQALKDESDALAKQNADLAAQKDALEKQGQAKQAQYESLVGDLTKEVHAGQLKITQYKNMLSVDMADQILFDSGKADLKPDGKAVLRKVAAALAKDDKIIRVEGHTDNVPLGPHAGFASNWELSTARATTVVRFLQDQGGLDPTRLIASGRGQYDPVAPNDTPEDRQKNRRIDITLLDRSLVDAVAMVPASPTATTAPKSLSPAAR